MKNFALPLLLLSACFQPVAGTPADGGFQSEPDAGSAFYCDVYAAAHCEQSVRCGETMGLFLDRCLVAAKGRCTSASREKGHQLPDPSKAQACLDGLKGACRRQGITYDCDHVFVGAVAEHGACLVPADCADPKQSCGGPDCAKTCQRAGNLGEPCLQDPRCNFSFVCDSKTITCTRRDPPGQIGGDCGNYYPFQCESNATCDFSTRKCIALPVAGQKCSFTQERCASSAVCKGDTCQPRLAAGAACPNTDNCLPGLFCDGKCKPRLQGGSACLKTEQCNDGLACVAGTCAVPRTPGETCAATSECESSLSCDKVSHVCTDFTLRTAIGETCTDDRTRCLSPLRCVGGTCQAAPVCSCSAAQRCEPTLSGEFTCVDLAPEGTQCQYPSECQAPFWCLWTKTGMRCTKPPALGEACQITKSNDAPCLFPLSCRDSVCVEAGAAGEACLRGSWCISGGCSPTTYLCGEGLPDGETCNSDASCASNTCLRRQCTSTCGG